MIKNVFILEDASEMGGVQHSTYNFLKDVKESDIYNFRVLIPEKGTFSNFLDSENISYSIYESIKLLSTSISFINDTLRIPNPISWIINYYSLRKSRLSLFKLLSNEPKSILITKGLGSHFLGAFVAKKNGIPCIMYLQDELSPRYFGLNIFFFNFFVLKHATKIITDGNTIKSQLWNKYLSITSIIYNGVSSKDNFVPHFRNSVRNELHLPLNAFVIGHIARITPWKGQLYLLNAFIKYAKENDNAYLILVGSPLFTDNSYFTQLKYIAENSDFSSRIIFTGYSTDLGKLLSSFDLFLYPSLEKDTTPLALLSALVSGIPVAFSNIHSLSEVKSLIPDLQVFDPKNIDEIISVIRASKQSIIISKNEKVRELANYYFSSEVMSSRILEILKSI
jgi:glycosyltransferase involved in cell wall biosynthesis